MKMLLLIFFFFNDTATTEIYTLSLHDALPISCPPGHGTMASFRTTAPGSFKRLLGRIRSRPSATRRADQTPHKTKGEAERSRNEDAEQRALIGARGYDHRADEPERQSGPAARHLHFG